MEKLISLEIDGKEVKAREGMTVLEAAKEVGIEIPTLCYHEKLEPYGACRICRNRRKNSSGSLMWLSSGRRGEGKNPL